MTRLEALAHNLGLKAIAEGVESERQLAALQSQECDEFQGHYFSPSVSGDAFARLVTGWQPEPVIREELEAPRISSSR